MAALATTVVALRPQDEQVSLFAAPAHALYDGRFHIEADNAFMVGGLDDPEGWDHIDNLGRAVRPVEARITIRVDEIANTGLVVLDAELPQGALSVVMDRFEEWAPYQDGGIATRIFEHGDSGNGDTLYPRTWLYLGGWGRADAFLDGRLLYEDYEAHFMVMEGARDDRTLEVRYPDPYKTSPAGQVNPADMEVDFYIRSPAINNANNPPREVFLHWYFEDVTWR